MGNSKSHHELTLREMPVKVRELHYAVMTNDRETVQNLINNGVNINFPWYNPAIPSVKDGSTPLIIAVSLNYTEIVEVLLRAGAYINKCDGNGCTPVYKAAFHGRPSLIEVLSRAGADVNLSDFCGKTPLYICVNNAIVHSCKSAIAKLLSGGAIVDKREKAGQAPIHLAAHWKLPEIMQLLIAANSNVNIVDHKGRTPLFVCLSSLSTKLYAEDLRHQLPCILTLFKAGADMLNMAEWVLYKGPGITHDHLNGTVGATEFLEWFTMQITRPQTLKHQCRKVIQKCVCPKGNLVELSKKKLPLPSSLQTFVSRKMFFREPQTPPYTTPITTPDTRACPTVWGK